MGAATSKRRGGSAAAVLDFAVAQILGDDTALGALPTVLARMVEAFGLRAALAFQPSEGQDPAVLAMHPAGAVDQAILASHGQGVSLGHPGVPGAVLSAGLLLCVCALLGLALGAIIRHTAGGIAATIAVILVPGIAALLPSPWDGRIGRFTLLEAAQQVSALHPAADLFSPGWSLLVLLAWPAAGLAAAALLITRRDA